MQASSVITGDTEIRLKLIQLGEQDAVAGARSVLPRPAVAGDRESRLSWHIESSLDLNVRKDDTTK